MAAITLRLTGTDVSPTVLPSPVFETLAEALGVYHCIPHALDAVVQPGSITDVADWMAAADVLVAPLSNPVLVAQAEVAAIKMRVWNTRLAVASARPGTGLAHLMTVVNISPAVLTAVPRVTVTDLVVCGRVEFPVRVFGTVVAVGDQRTVAAVAVWVALQLVGVAVQPLPLAITVANAVDQHRVGDALCAKTARCIITGGAARATVSCREYLAARAMEPGITDSPVLDVKMCVRCTTSAVNRGRAAARSVRVTVLMTEPGIAED
jgi:hypothetical protein